MQRASVVYFARSRHNDHATELDILVKYFQPISLIHFRGDSNLNLERASDRKQKSSVNCFVADQFFSPFTRTKEGMYACIREDLN